MASRSGPEAAKQPQTITLPPPCLTVGMMFFLWNPVKNFSFCRISPQNICPKVLGMIKIFFGKCETSLCVLFGQQWLLPWNSPMDTVFAQPLFYCWMEWWTLTLIEASEACGSLDVVRGSFMTSWMSRHCTLGVILVGLGRFTTVTSFLHLCIGKERTWQVVKYGVPYLEFVLCI